MASGRLGQLLGWNRLFSSIYYSEVQTILKYSFSPEYSSCCMIWWGRCEYCSNLAAVIIQNLKKIISRTQMSHQQEVKLASSLVPVPMSEQASVFGIDWVLNWKRPRLNWKQVPSLAWVWKGTHSRVLFLWPPRETEFLLRRSLNLPRFLQSS